MHDFFEEVGERRLTQGLMEFGYDVKMSAVANRWRCFLINHSVIGVSI